jgi:hypothetical protein
MEYNRGNKRAISVFPSKKILPIIAICIVAVGLTAIAFFYHPTPKASISSGALTVESQVETAQSQLLDKDSDNDGLKDWEETLWSSDPHNPDTSGDGIPDGEEVKEGRNPLLKWPNNLLPAGSLPSGAASQANKVIHATTTATDILGETLLSQYMALKESGQTITPDMEQTLVDNFAQSDIVGPYIPQAKVYTISDLSVSTDNSQAALKKYGNAVGQAMIKNSPLSGISALIVEETAVNSGSEQDLSGLATIVTSSSELVKELLDIPVPSSAVAIHLAILNDVSASLNSVQGMQQLFNDPVVALAALKAYETTLPALSTDIHTLSVFFQSKNVLFGTTDPGSVLSS